MLPAPPPQCCLRSGGTHDVAHVPASLCPAHLTGCLEAMQMDPFVNDCVSLSTLASHALPLALCWAPPGRRVPPHTGPV